MDARKLLKKFAKQWNIVTLQTCLRFEKVFENLSNFAKKFRLNSKNYRFEED